MRSVCVMTCWLTATGCTSPLYVWPDPIDPEGDRFLEIGGHFHRGAAELEGESDDITELLAFGEVEEGRGWIRIPVSEGWARFEALNVSVVEDESGDVLGPRQVRIESER